MNFESPENDIGRDQTLNLNITIRNNKEEYSYQIFSFLHNSKINDPVNYGKEPPTTLLLLFLSLGTERALNIVLYKDPLDHFLEKYHTFL